jgi:hypothetical protein
MGRHESVLPRQLERKLASFAMVSFSIRNAGFSITYGTRSVLPQETGQWMSLMMKFV